MKQRLLPSDSGGETIILHHLRHYNPDDITNFANELWEFSNKILEILRDHNKGKWQWREIISNIASTEINARNCIETEWHTSLAKTKRSWYKLDEKTVQRQLWLVFSKRIFEQWIDWAESLFFNLYCHFEHKKADFLNKIWWYAIDTNVFSNDIWKKMQKLYNKNISTWTINEYIAWLDISKKYNIKNSLDNETIKKHLEKFLTLSLNWENWEQYFWAEFPDTISYAKSLLWYYFLWEKIPNKRQEEVYGYLCSFANNDKLDWRNVTIYEFASVLTVACKYLKLENLDNEQISKSITNISNSAISLLETNEQIGPVIYRAICNFVIKLTELSELELRIIKENKRFRELSLLVYNSINDQWIHNKTAEDELSVLKRWLISFGIE